jgi:hypothetical protein
MIHVLWGRITLFVIDKIESEFGHTSPGSQLFTLFELAQYLTSYVSITMPMWCPSVLMGFGVVCDAACSVLVLV